MDYLMQAYEQRLVEVLEQSRYDELDAEDLPRLLRSVELALGAPSLVQGARELMLLLDDLPDAGEPLGGLGNGGEAAGEEEVGDAPA